jgi:hypothetical protein
MPFLKRHYIHIVFSWVLLANLFSQSALNFFHHHEEEEVSIEKSIRSGKAKVLCKEHTESCKVCDLNLFHELFADELSVITFTPKIYSAHYSYSESFSGINPFFRSGRAPPICTSLL